MADQPIFAAPAARTRRDRAGPIAAHVRAALFLGHAHADHHRLLAGAERDVARIVLAGEQLLAQGRVQRGLLLQNGNAGEGHGQRAQRAAFQLRVEKISGGARGHGAGFRRSGFERQRMKALLAQHGKQRVPRRMEFDCINTLAARAERVVFGRMPVGQVGERKDIGMGERQAVAGERIEVPRRAFALDGADQRRVAGERVVTLERRDLVRDFVRLAVGG